MAKKDLHDARLEKGLAALAAQGVAVDAAAPARIAELKNAVGASADADIAAIFLLGKIAATESLNVLREIEKNAADKDVKKEIKRAYFKLAQKGVVPAEEAPVEKRPVALFERSADIEAYMSAVDDGGGRLIWIAKAEPNRGLQVIQAMLHDREGLLRFGGVHMKRKELRGMADEIQREHGVSMIAIPWQFADQMIYEGYERAKGRGQSGLENFHDIRSLIGTGKPKPVAHPIYAKLGSEDFRD
ncbi:MAG: hypothetical protein FJ143_12815, partial [Deltaproteobacteria bacterium]|nr:hypothetical protein [Deltaproteobacteria bacterium]